MYQATNAVAADYGMGFSSYDDNATDQAPLCDCGLPCITLTSRTSANMNRQFYKCPNAGAAADGAGVSSCRYFEWLDQGSSGGVEQGSRGGLLADGSSNVIRDYQTENRRVFGHNAFRAGQKECIEAALQGV